VIGAEGEQLGIMSSAEALRLAQQRGVDLVEVAPTAVPPVCRLLDYGKFKYEQTKKERQARKHQKTTDLKEVRLHPKIDPHDLEVKINAIRSFLSEGDKVKVTVIFRAREITHPEIGQRILEHLIGSLKEVSLLEQSPLREGRNLSVILAPGIRKAQTPGEKPG